MRVTVALAVVMGGWGRVGTAKGDKWGGEDSWGGREEDRARAVGMDDAGGVSALLSDISGRSPRLSWPCQLRLRFPAPARQSPHCQHISVQTRLADRSHSGHPQAASYDQTSAHSAPADASSSSTTTPPKSGSTVSCPSRSSRAGTESQ